ncbi:P1 family peptidase [Tomitella gaofuii]|uniref:P1 family peptidase n=1 Tax=Tomitella gaofuii TaxID=2760083 RepID=UPI0039A50F0E
MTGTGAMPGAANALIDVPGIRVGHAHRLDAGVTVGAADGSSDGEGWATGCTVVRMPAGGAVAAVDVRGGGPGTRETDLLDPAHTVQRAHAILLTGGSAFGLAAADGVMRRLEDEGVGIPMGGAGKVVPIVPAAVIFDLPVGGWHNRPDAAFGYAAAAAATADVPPAGAVDSPGAAAIATVGGGAAGCVGAGVGARAGGLKGGIGSASAVIDGGPADGVTVGALVVANPVGSVVDPGGVPWGAGAELAGEFAGLRRDPGPEVRARVAGLAAKGTVLNTTIGVVATDAALTPAGCRRLATVAHDGLARAIRPAHSPLDGDTLFAVATGMHEAAGAQEPAAPAPPVPAEMPGDLALLTALCGPAADCVERAVVHAVLAAESVAGIPSYRAVIG